MAGRPRKPETERLEDLFYDADYETQASLLETFRVLHRLKARQTPEKRQPSAKTEPAKEAESATG